MSNMMENEPEEMNDESIDEWEDELSVLFESIAGYPPNR